jgi:hypothetical protein
MTLSILAFLFLLLIVLITIVGYRTITGRVRSIETKKTEQCLLCRRDFERGELVERNVGDYKLIYFCTECVQSLQAEMTAKHS